MKCMFSAAVILALALAGSTWAQEKAPGKNGVPKEDLPYQDRITWDVKVFEEDKESFTLLKRTAGKKEVVWLLELNSDTEVGRIVYYNISVRYQALFLDADGVQVAVVVVAPHTQNIRKGERVRYTLTMPADDVIQKTTEVIIKLR